MCTVNANFFVVTRRDRDARSLLFVCAILVCLYVHVWILCEYAHAVKSHDTSRTSASLGLSSAAWPDEFSWFIYTIRLMSHARAQDLFLYTRLYPPRNLK